MGDRPETHDLNMRRNNIFSQHQRARLQRLAGKGSPGREGLAGNSSLLPLTAKHLAANGPFNGPDLGFAQNWHPCLNLRNSNLLSQSLNLDGLISIQGAIESQITKRPTLETKRKATQRNRLCLSVANKGELKIEEPVQKIDTNCQTDGIESTRYSMNKTHDLKWAQQTFRNEQSSRLQNQNFKIKTALNSKRSRESTKKRFGIQGNAISKEPMEENKPGIAAVSVPQVKNSLDDIIDLKIDQDLQSILVKSQIQEEDVTNGGEESYRRRKTITVKGYPLTATPLEMSKVEIDKVNLVKQEQPPSRQDHIPKNLASYRSSQASCHSGAQELKQKFSIHQSDQQGLTSRKINDRTVDQQVVDQTKIGQSKPTQKESNDKVQKGREGENQKTEPHLKEGNKKESSGPKFMSDHQQMEHEDGKLIIKEELASDTAEAAEAESRGRETVLPVESKKGPHLGETDPFIQCISFERKQVHGGKDQKPSQMAHGRVPEIALKNLQELAPNQRDSSQRRSLMVNQSAVNDSARSRNQSQRSQCSRVNCKESSHHYQKIKDYINIQYQKYEREGSSVIANHAKMVPPARTQKNSTLNRFKRGYKRSGTYELSDQYSIDPFSIKEDPRSKSPNLLQNIALAQSPSFKIEQDSIQVSKPNGKNGDETQRRGGNQRTPFAEGQPSFDLEPRKGAITGEEKEIIMNKIQVRDGRVKQREPASQINNDDLAGLQIPDNGKVEDGKKFKIRKQIIVSSGGNAKIKNEKISKKGGINSIDVSRLKNYEIIQNTVGSGSLQNPSTSRLQNLNSQRTDNSPNKSVEHPTLSAKSKDHLKAGEDPQIQRARQLMESKIENFKKSLRMSLDNKIDYQNQPKLYRQRFTAVHRRSIQAQKQSKGAHKKQVREIYYSLHRQKNKARQSLERDQLEDISLLEMSQMKTKVKNISKLSPIKEQNQQPKDTIPQNLGFLSPPHKLMNLPLTQHSSNSEIRGGYSVDDSGSIGSKEANLFILMPLSQGKQGISQTQKIEDHFLKKRKIQPVPMNETQQVIDNRQKFEIKKQLGRTYYKKFIQKIDDTDVLEMIMEQGRAGTVKQSEDHDSQLTSQITQDRPKTRDRPVTQDRPMTQERAVPDQVIQNSKETFDGDDASKLHTALAKYEDTASYQKKFMSEVRSSKADTMYLQDPDVPSRNQITITNSSIPRDRTLIKSFDSKQYNDTENSLNNDLLHIKQVKKFHRRENARKLTTQELKKYRENYIQMQQLLNSNMSNSSGEKVKVHNIPDMNMIMEMDQLSSEKGKPSDKHQANSSERVHSFSGEQNSQTKVQNLPLNTFTNTYNAVIIPLSQKPKIHQPQVPLNPTSTTLKHIGTGFIPFNQSQFSSNHSAADSPIVYGESPIMSQAFIDKHGVKYTYQTMEECMQKRKLEGKKQVATLPISVNTQTVNANTMTVSKNNSLVRRSNKFFDEGMTNF